MLSMAWKKSKKRNHGVGVFSFKRTRHSSCIAAAHDSTTRRALDVWCSTEARRDEIIAIDVLSRTVVQRVLRSTVPRPSASRVTHAAMTETSFRGPCCCERSCFPFVRVCFKACCECCPGLRPLVPPGGPAWTLKKKKKTTTTTCGMIYWNPIDVENYMCVCARLWKSVGAFLRLRILWP